MGADRVEGRLGTAKIGVLTITDEEFVQARKIFNAVQNVQGSPYYVADSTTTTHDVVLSQALDRTNLPAGKATHDLIEDWRPWFIFLIGTAGGVLEGEAAVGRDGTYLGDVVVADFIEYTEFRKLIKGRSAKRSIPHDHPSLYLRGSFARPAVWDDWAAAIPVIRPHDGSGSRKKPQVKVGTIVAGEKILSDWTNEYQSALVDEFDKALAFETESFGVAREIFAYRSSMHYNPQFLTIRGISDFVNAKEANADRKRWTDYAAASALTFAHRVIERLLEFLANSEPSSTEPTQEPS